MPAVSSSSSAVAAVATSAASVVLAAARGGAPARRVATRRRAEPRAAAAVGPAPGSRWRSFAAVGGAAWPRSRRPGTRAASSAGSAGGGFEASEGVSLGAAAQREAQIAELLAAAKRGRVDLALKLAKPLAAAEGLDAGASGAAAFVARECSDRAAASYAANLEGWERGLTVAASGASFDLPGRAGKAVASELGSYWLQDVSIPHEQATTVLKLCRVSLALRGLEPLEAAAEAQARCAAGDPAALRDVAAGARDCRLMGRAVTVRFGTGRLYSVAQTFVARRFSEDSALVARHPALLSLLVKARTHFREHLQDMEPPVLLQPPEEPLVFASAIATPAAADEDGSAGFPRLRQWAEERQAAASRQLRIAGELVSEAATGLVASRDLEEALALVEATAGLFEAEGSVADKRWARTVLRSTAEKLRDRR